MAENSAAQTAFDPLAPSQERLAALGELQRAHMPLASELLDQEAIREFAEGVQGAYDQMALDSQLAKSMNSTVVPFPSKRLAEREPGMHSVSLDELQVSIAGDFIERPGILQYDGLRAMVEQTPILGAVINTRIRQVSRFARIAETGELPGFEIRHVNREHQLTEGEREQKQLLQKFIQHCGWEFSPWRRKQLKRESFKGFLSKYVRDSLTMDSAGIELEWKRDARRGLDGFYAVDGSTIRLCSEQGYQGDDEIFALQVVAGRVCTAYSYRDLVYEPRNPRTDVRACGYGLSEVETLIRVVTGFLNAMTYNSKGFDTNSIPKGMLHLTGNYSASDIAAFKRIWTAQLQGAGGNWALPVMVSKDQESKASFETFGLEFNEMHFAKWMTFLTSICCAIFGMSPIEINFDSFTAGSSSTLSGSDTGEKLASSKDSGLYPLLTQVGDTMSDFIVGTFGDDWCFRWTGLEPDDADKRSAAKIAAQTVDESRAELGMVKHPDPLIGAAPLNTALVSLYTQIIQPKLQPAPDTGAPGAAPAGAPGADAGGAPAPGANFGQGAAQAGGPAGDGDFGDEGDQGFGYTKQPATGDGGAPPAAAGSPDFGDPPGQDFGKALPNVYEVAL